MLHLLLSRKDRVMVRLQILILLSLSLGQFILIAPQRMLHTILHFIVIKLSLICVDADSHLGSLCFLLPMPLLLNHVALSFGCCLADPRILHGDLGLHVLLQLVLTIHAH